ncbi:MAG TPA: DUF4157 domain-containing protein [Longimicrobium sp.]|nr:DUF4157 domain-containing protein [Longimicrobium sp.]
MRERVNPLAKAVRPPEAPPAAAVRVVPGPGAPAGAGAPRQMERRLGHDFGAVRVHTDARAGAR